MNRILLGLHVALVSTVLLPMYTLPHWFDRPALYLDLPYRPDTPCHQSDALPLEEALKGVQSELSLKSVLAAGLPAFLALLNLPLLIYLRDETGRRWRALSSLVLGLLSMSLLAQLLARYGEGRAWGAWTLWTASLALTIAGLATTVRLRRSGEPAVT